MNGFLRIDNALADAAECLRSVSDSPRLDAELLLALALDVPRSYLFAHAEEEMDSAAIERFQTTIGRRADGVPVAYITGEKEFWSMPLMVSPATLVPRPETELLVEQALSRIPPNAAWRILDLGTGSGAIALAVATERPNCHVVATDISEDALAVARINARQHGVPNIEFIQGSWVDPVSELMFDLILSNPPYVANNDDNLGNLRHEPRTALASGKDGLDAIRIIACRSGNVIKPGGELLIEHGAGQEKSVSALLTDNGWTEVITQKDFNGLPRVTSARRSNAFSA